MEEDRRKSSGMPYVLQMIKLSQSLLMAIPAVPRLSSVQYSAERILLLQRFTHKKNQYSIDRYSATFDMLAVDDNGNLYDVEMRRSSISRKELGTRASYYEAMQGTRALEKGENYSKLKERKAKLEVEMKEKAK